MSTERSKPTGETGSVSFGPGSEAPAFAPVPFPSTKEAIERFIALPFVELARKSNLLPFTVVGEPEQNPTDDFDFTLRTDTAHAYLELMEMHLRDIGDETPSGQFVYEPYVVAERLLQRIQAKSIRYRGATSQPIILLTYVTHWQFCLADLVFWLLAYWMRQSQSIFAQVWHLSILDATSSEAFLLYPTTRDLSDFDPEKYRDNRTILLNPRGWQLRRK